MIIKICGIRTLADGLAAAAAGADILGFNFYPRSARYLAPDEIAEIVTRLRPEFPEVLLAGVFVNHDAEKVVGWLESLGLDIAQLSGDEPLADIEAIGNRAVKVVRSNSEKELLAAIPLLPERSSPQCLIDSDVRGSFGGTGVRADWGLASRAAAKAEIILAGGLSPENVAEAIHAVRPWGVDVASGVEEMGGFKDQQKVRAFINRARKAAQQIEDIHHAH